MTTRAEKLRARALVNLRVKTGKLPSPNELPCADCGHRWVPGERRHEYDHPRGYVGAAKLDVEPVCTLCHAKRDSPKKAQTHCKRGHEFSPENTEIAANGTRKCRECRRVADRKRTPRGSDFWRRVNAKRRAA
jgi:hypothetical protein